MSQQPFLFTLLLLGALAFRAHVARAYRPFDGTDADVAQAGEFELELGPVHYVREGPTRSLLAPATVLNLGIVPRVELVADINNTIVFDHADPSAFQLTGTDVFVKILVRRGVLQQQSGPSVALETGPLVPEVNGEKGFGYSLNLIVSERFDWLVLHLNNTAALSRGSLGFEWTESLIAEGDFGAPIRPVAEVIWARALPTGSMRYTALAGAIWTLSENLALDAALVMGSVEHELVYETRLGFTWSVAIWEPKA